MKRERLDVGPIYPQVKVKLVGQDGNAYSILARCRTAMRKAKLSDQQWNDFHAKATSGDYNNLLQTTMKYFACDEDGEDDDDC